MSDDITYAQSLVAARIPEMSAAELIAPLGEDSALVSDEILGRIADVLTAFEERLERLEARVARRAA